MENWSLTALVTSVRQLFLSCAKKIQPTLVHLHPGLPSGFFHSRFPISYILTHLHPGLPCGFFHSRFPISYILTHLHPGLPSGFFHSRFPISYILTHLHPGLPSGFFHSHFPISYFIPVRAICPVHLILLYSVNGTNRVACYCVTFCVLSSLLPAKNQESFSTHILD